MDTRKITPRYHVAPQITSEDVPAIKAAGFVRVICNRPDGEVPAPLQAAALGKAVREAGMAFFELPLTHQTMTPDNIALQRKLFEEADGPVLAYCASGTRCTVIWALGQASEMDIDDILEIAADGGYDLRGMRTTLMTIAENR